MHCPRRRRFLIAVKLDNHPLHQVDLRSLDSAIMHQHACQNPDQNPSLNLDLDQGPEEDRVHHLIMDQGTNAIVETQTMVTETIAHLDMDRLDQLRK